METVTEVEAAPARRVRPRVSDDHPDMLRFAQDRHRTAFCGILYPKVDVATSEFIRSLEHSPGWMTSHERELYEAIERERDLPTLDQRMAKLKSTRARLDGVDEDPGQGDLFRGRVFRIAQLPEVLAHCQGRNEHYVSQCSFTGWRRSSASVRQLTSCWVDLDFYPKPPAKNGKPRPVLVAPGVARALADDTTAVDMITNRCLEAGKDGRWFMPTQIVKSGRGIYVKWIFDEFLPGDAGPRWKRVQDRLIELFTDMGADPAARDAARVLRVIGSVNSKAPGLPVRVLMAGKPLNFNDLADALLPHERMTRWDREATKTLKKQANKKFGPLKPGRRRPAAQVQQQADGAATASKMPWTVASAAWTLPLVDELEQLIQARGEANHGHMERTAWIVMVYQLLNGTVVTKQEFDARVQALAVVMGADGRVLANQVGSVWSQHQRELAGAPRSRKPSKAGVIEMLQITEAELANMPALAKTGDWRPPERTRQQLAEDIESARLLIVSGMKLNDVASHFGVTRWTAKRWLSKTT